MGIFVPLLGVIGAGLLWQRFSPGGVSAADLRRHLNALMLYLLVPALVFHVMVQAPLDRQLLAVVSGGWITIGFSGVLAWGLHLLLARYSSLSRATRGALILAAIFGNGLGAALPLVHQLYAGRQDEVALGFDLLATIPVSWTLGVYIAIRFGREGASATSPFRQILSLPPIWAVTLALTLNALDLQPSPVIMETLEGLSQAALPLMLLTLGLALDFRPHAAWRWMVIPILIRLLGGLLIGLFFGLLVGLPPEEHRAFIWVCAAPPIMMGILFCDRFGLDTSAFALTMSGGVLVYLLVLPLLISMLPL